MILRGIYSKLYRIRSVPNTFGKKKEIYFSWDFNEPISEITLLDESYEDITNSIELIVFGYSYNQSLDKLVFPPFLKHLIIGWSFSHSLDNLPSTLESLTIINLKKPLRNLPSSIKKIEFGWTHESIINECKIPFDCSISFKN